MRHARHRGWHYLLAAQLLSLTGWAQLNYQYGSSIDDAKKKLEYDLYYVKNASLFLDLVILLQTVEVVLWGKGAR